MVFLSSVFEWCCFCVSVFLLGVSGGSGSGSRRGNGSGNGSDI